METAIIVIATVLLIMGILILRETIFRRNPFTYIKRPKRENAEKPDKAIEIIERRIRTIQNQMVSSDEPHIVLMFKHKLNELEIVLAEIKEKDNE